MTLPFIPAAPSDTDDEFDFRKAAKRGVAIWMRQSLVDMVNPAVGSQLMQSDEGVKQAAALGVPEHETHRFFAWGERSTEDADREQFEALEALVEQGGIGVLIVADHHRVGRTTEHSKRLYRACARHNVLLKIGGTPLDPRRTDHWLVLSVLAEVAEFENKNRSRWMTKSRVSLARKLAFRKRLPAGLVWVAGERDATYRRRAALAGCLPFLERAIHGEHVTRVYEDGVRYFVLPFPDTDVLHSIELRFAWLFETRSLEGVVTRIRDEASAWPSSYRGLVPSFDRDSVYDENLKPTWVPVVPSNLRRWLLSPALYGIYALFGFSAVGGRQRISSTGAKGVHRPRKEAAFRAPLPSALELLGLEEPTHAPKLSSASNAGAATPVPETVETSESISLPHPEGDDL